MPAEEGKSKRPLDTKFRQQKLPAWRPILTPTAVIVAFLAVGFVFLPIGGVVYMASSKVEEVETVNYVNIQSDGGCCISNCDDVSINRVDANPCTINLNVTADMEPPIYMYYKLTRFYQNHRMYVKSRNDPQLAGGTGFTPDDLAPTCKVAGSDSNVGWARADWDSDGEGGDLVSNSVSPCGLIAFSMFNDSFQLQEVNSSGVYPVVQTSADISWESDREIKFKNAEDGSTGNNFPGFAREKTTPCSVWPVTGEAPSADMEAACEAAQLAAADGLSPGWCFKGSGLCMEDEHFIVWMRTAGLPNFRKLYAKIDQPLYADREYKVHIWNGFDASPHGGGNGAGNLFPTHTFKGEKYVVLSTTEWIGGRNDFLGIAYLIVGSICILLALVFFVKSQCSPASDFGSVANGGASKESS